MNTTICALLLSISLTGLARNANATADDHTDRHKKVTYTSEKINRLVSNSFKNDFRNAVIISCEVSRNVTNLTFVMNDLIMHAFYAGNGDLLGVTRNILTSQLPIDLLLKFRQDYQDYWVTDLFEVTSREDHAYFITLENAGTRIVLRSADNFNWEIYKRTNKD
jgi:hypothetical protein